MGSSTEVENRLAVVIVVDGLRASALGAYGNTSFPTPLFDEFASQSLVIEWLLSTGPTLSDFYHGAFSGIESAAAHRCLLTDDASIVGCAPSNLFQQVAVIEPGADRHAQGLEGTHAANFFTLAVEQLAAWKKEIEQDRRGALLWIHFSGLSGPWDAPIAMREDYLDEDDPPAPEFVVPPRDSRGVVDPDELLGYRVAYAAQVSVIEPCLAGFVQAFDELPFTGKKLAMLAGGRGFSLGEHGYVGHGCQTVYSEQLHLPLLVLPSEAGGPLSRATGFAQPADIGATVAHWISGDADSNPVGQSLIRFLESRPGHLRNVVIARNAAGESMIRTPAWLMKQGTATELFAKPDDRWEANDVATRCPDIVEQLSKHVEVLNAGNAERLSDELTSPWR
jgi:hypothetical protein